MPDNDFYSYTDSALRYLRRYFVREFNKTSAKIRIDSLNIIQKTTDLYDRLYAETIRVFLTIARSKYRSCMGTDTVEVAWLMVLLETANPLTGYAFMNDKDRKRQYYTEAIMSGGDVPKETQKAMRYLYGSVKQYADLVTDEAAVKAFSDNGVQFVKWRTAHDERVCSECGPRDGRIYPLKYVPVKPHYGCRCYLVGV